MGMLEEQLKEMDKPLDISKPTGIKFFKKGKVRIILIYEDQSYAEHYISIAKENYFFTIKNRKYLINPKAFLFGKQPIGVWYFNNPVQVQLPYTTSKVTAGLLNADNKLMSRDMKELYGNIILDAEALHAAFTSNVIKGLYARQWLTGKMLLIILGVALMAVLVILQLTGKVDVFGFLTGKGG